MPSSRAVNRTLLATARQLNTLIYASRDRFSHDAADMTPIMRAKGATLAPGIAKAAALAELEPGNDRGFLLSELRRQANRFRATLRHAQERLAASGPS
jgi:hypothetical protein